MYIIPKIKALEGPFATVEAARKALAECKFTLAWTPLDHPTPKWVNLLDTSDERAIGEGDGKWYIVPYPDPSRFEEIELRQAGILL